VQTTLRSAIDFKGVGLHSGRPVRLRIEPAPEDHGLRFVRSDLDHLEIPARWDRVEDARLCTRIFSDSVAGAQVSTIEHVMAALAGCGVQNARLVIDAPEVPILDGSSAPFVEAIRRVGLVRQNRPLRALAIRQAVEVQMGEARARLEPAERFEIRFEIDFADRAIGHQRKRLDMANGAFVRELMDCRTFCRAADIDAMRARGLALGGTYENAVVVDGEKVLSPGGLRHRDEAVRHKMLDAMGDLALAGGPILGRYTGIRAGHALTNALLRKLFDTPGAAEWVTLDAVAVGALPGAGVCALHAAGRGAARASAA